MKVLLICPPVADFTIPYLSLPALAGSLRSRGISTSQWDLNLDFALHFFRKEYCAAARDRVVARHRELDEKPSLGFQEMREYLVLSRVLPFADFIVDNVETAVDVVREQRPQDAMITRGRARTLLEQALQLVSMPYYPESLGGSLRQPTYQTRFSPYSSEECIASMDDRHSLLDHVYQALVGVRLAAEAPDIVGISMTYPDQVIPAMKLCRSIRAARPGVHICVGGAFLSVTRSREVRNSSFFDHVDSVVIDTGELPLSRLAAHLAGENVPLESIPGLIYRAGGEVHHNRPALPNDFASLPAPDYDGLDLARYLVRPSKMEVSLILAYGCYWRKCAFCDTALPYVGALRPQPVDGILTRIRTMIEATGCRRFHFVDEACPPKTLKALSERLIAENLEISWHGNIRLDRFFTADVCRLMARAGCFRIECGLETANDRLLALIDKGTSRAQVEGVMDNLRAAGIEVHGYLIHGLPTETADEARTGFELIRSYIRSGRVSSVAYHNFYLTRYSPMFRNPGNFGITRIHDLPGLDFVGHCPHETASGMNREERDAMFEELTRDADRCMAEARLGAGAGNRPVAWWQGAGETGRVPPFVRTRRVNYSPGDIGVILDTHGRPDPELSYNRWIAERERCVERMRPRECMIAGNLISGEFEEYRPEAARQ